MTRGRPQIPGQKSHSSGPEAPHLYNIGARLRPATSDGTNRLARTSHHLPPARAAAPRTSHGWSSRSPPIIEELFGWPLRARTGRLRCQAHRGGIAGDTRGAGEVPGRSHRPSRIWEWGPSRIV